MILIYKKYFRNIKNPKIIKYLIQKINEKELEYLTI